MRYDDPWYVALFAPVIGGLVFVVCGAVAIAAGFSFLGGIPVILVTAFSRHPVLAMPEWMAIFCSVIYGSIWLWLIGRCD